MVRGGGRLWRRGEVFPSSPRPDPAEGYPGRARRALPAPKHWELRGGSAAPSLQKRAGRLGGARLTLRLISSLLAAAAPAGAGSELTRLPPRSAAAACAQRAALARWERCLSQPPFA